MRAVRQSGRCESAAWRECAAANASGYGGRHDGRPAAVAENAALTGGSPRSIHSDRMGARTIPEIMAISQSINRSAPLEWGRAPSPKS